jgi:ABC-type nitrate/sulfonate/bicarbonate transport system ATPase subunit
VLALGGTLAPVRRMSAAIEVRDVWKRFQRKGRHVDALQGISLDVQAKQFVAILGPSGCGKSTLLNMVAGFDQPTTGSVTVNGQPVLAPSPRRGVVFQEPALFPWYSVLENVTFGAKQQRRKPADYLPKAAEILAQVGLEGFGTHYPAELSGGMKQRVGLARVLMLEPEVLLMDEPFGALDAQTRSLMQELLLEVWERSRQTVMFITHDIDESLLLADVIHVMTARPGRLKQQLTVDLPRPRSVDVMMSAPFNEMKKQIRALIHDEAVQAARER